jgi:hypothetical protein
MRPIAIVYLAAAALVAVYLVFFGPTSAPCHGEMLCMAYKASMRADLRNLVVAEEAYRGDHSVYTANLASLSYAVSPGSHVQVTWAGRDGWRAVATLRAVATRQDSLAGECAIFVGTVPEPPRVAGVVPNEGEPRCGPRTR